MTDELHQLLDHHAAEKFAERINKLTPETIGLWGKMNVAQMLAHCAHAIEVPLGDVELKKSLFGKIFGKWIKKVIVEKKKFKQGLPTAPQFKIKTEHDFETEKKKLISHINRFALLDTKTLDEKYHPIGGKFTAEEWRWSQYKHLDHHLSQFGV